MTDAEGLTLYGECVIKASQLGLKLDVHNNQIHVIKSGRVLLSRMKIPQIEMFLIGYETAMKELQNAE